MRRAWMYAYAMMSTVCLVFMGWMVLDFYKEMVARRMNPPVTFTILTLDDPYEDAV